MRTIQSMRKIRMGIWHAKQKFIQSFDNPPPLPPKGKGSLERPTYRLKDNIKFALKEKYSG